MEESGRLPSRWRRFWLGTLKWLSCGACSGVPIEKTGCPDDVTLPAVDSQQLHTGQEDGQQQQVQSEEEKGVHLSPLMGLSDDCLLEDISLPHAEPQLVKLQDGQQEQVHSEEEQGSHLSPLMGLPDDCLLEIIDRLPFLDRLSVRAAHTRLYILEQAAVATVPTDRFRIPNFMMRFHDGEARIFLGRLSSYLGDNTNPPHACSMPYEEGFLMLRRAVKCCTFVKLELALRGDEKFVNELIFALRRMDECQVQVVRLRISSECSVRLARHLTAFIQRNARLRQLTVYFPNGWATAHEILELVDAQLEAGLKLFELASFGTEAAQELGRRYFGLSPTLFEYKPDGNEELGSIRTSFQNTPVFAAYEDLGDGRQLLRLRVKNGDTVKTLNCRREHNSFSLFVDENPRIEDYGQRVIYQQED